MNTQENPWTSDTPKSTALGLRRFRKSVGKETVVRAKWSPAPRCKRLDETDALATEHTALEEVIEDSKFILAVKYEEGEDETPSFQTWIRATKYLRRLSLYADIKGRDLPLPSVVPAHDGSIDLLWKTRSRGLLINFPGDGDKATYYGRKASIQTSGVLLSDEAHEELIRWLTQ